MLSRPLRRRLQQHRTAVIAQRIPASLVILSPKHSSRSFSLSTFTEPINNAIETLPLSLQYNIPESILALSETYVPAGLPTYTTGIVVFTILTRLCLFTPWSYWARRRKWRHKEIVEPRLLAETIYGWQKPLRERLTKQGVSPAEQKEIIKENMNYRGDQLAREYKCTPGPTIFAPIAFTVPAFIIGSSIMYSAAQLPAIAANPLLNELALVPSGTPILPLCLAAVGLASVDLGTFTPKTLKQMSNPSEQDAEAASKNIEKGNRNPTKKVVEAKPGTLVQSLFRALAVGRAAICVGLPGTISIYWLTSTTMSLVESIIFQTIEKNRYPKHWGRNSRLLLLPRDKLIEQGINLSPTPPLERAGLKNYSKIKNSGSQQHNKVERLATKALLTGLNGATAASEGAAKLAGSAKSRTMASIAWTKEKAHDAVMSVEELKASAVGYVVPKYQKLKNLDRKDVKKFQSEVGSRWDSWKWSTVEGMEEWLKHSKKKNGSKSRVRLSPDEFARRRRKRKQWLYVLGSMNKQQAKEMKKERKERAAREERERSIPGLQPPRWQPPAQDAADKKPLFH